MWAIQLAFLLFIFVGHSSPPWLFVIPLHFLHDRSNWFYPWRSWIRASWYNYEKNQQDALYRLIYYSRSSLHVLGDIFVHHQEHLTVFTVSCNVHPSCCQLVSRRDTSWQQLEWTLPDTVNTFQVHGSVHRYDNLNENAN